MSAWRMAVRGDIPGAKKNEMGRWVVPVEEPPGRTVAYCRVSSHDQKADLDGQVARVAVWAAEAGVRIDAFEREIGSGLNDRRRVFRRIVADPEVRVIVVEHRDRLARFGVESLEAALAAAGRQVVVLDDREVDDDLVRDMIDLMTSFSARLYGRRSARNRARRAAEALKP